MDCSLAYSMYMCARLSLATGEVREFHGPFHKYSSTHCSVEIVICYGHCWWTLDMSQCSCLCIVNEKIFTKWVNIQQYTKYLKNGNWFWSFLCKSLFWSKEFLAPFRTEFSVRMPCIMSALCRYEVLSWHVTRCAKCPLSWVQI